MAFWSRIKNSQLKLLTTQFKISYFDSKPTIFLTSRILNCQIPRTPSEFCHNARFFAAPVQVKPKQEERGKGGPRLNEKITARIVRLVVSKDEHTVVSRNEALERARKLNLDLVEVQPNADPPVCRLMDFHKEKYVKQVKEKDRAKSKATLKKADCKEIRFSPKCEQKDLDIKANTVKRLMESGYRVKCMAMGTEDQDLGGLLSRFSPLIEDVSIVESGPRVEKKQAYIIVRHIKFGPSKKGGKKALKVTGDATNETPNTNSTNQTSIQFEDNLHPAESEGESDDDVLSDEADDNMPSIQERNEWSVSDANDDFEKVFNFTDDVKDATSSFSSKEIKQTDTSQLCPPTPSAPRQQSSYGSFSYPKPKVERFSSDGGDQARVGPQLPRQTTQPRYSMNVSPSTNQVRTDASMLNNLKPSPKEVPRQEQSCPDPPKPTPSYGIFSGMKTNIPGNQQGIGSEMNTSRKGNPIDSKTLSSLGGVSANSESSTVHPEGRQRPSGQGGFGIFSRDNSSNATPSRMPQSQAKAPR